MKVTKRQLKKIIKEELNLVLKEQEEWPPLTTSPLVIDPSGRYEPRFRLDPKTDEIVGSKVVDHGNPQGDPQGDPSVAPEPRQSFADWTADVPGPRDVAKSTTSVPATEVPMPPAVTPEGPAPFEPAMAGTEARKRTAWDAQRDLDWAIKAYNFWGEADASSEDFKRAEAAVGTFRNEMLEMGTEPGSWPYSTPRKEGIHSIGRHPVYDPSTGEAYPRARDQDY